MGAAGRWYKDNVGKALQEHGAVILTSLYARVHPNPGFPASLDFLKCQTQYHILKFREVAPPDPHTRGVVPCLSTSNLDPLRRADFMFECFKRRGAHGTLAILYIMGVNIVHVHMAASGTPIAACSICRCYLRGFYNFASSAGGTPVAS
eukprot:7389590-Pyramimonas_sp.AAC.1